MSPLEVELLKEKLSNNVSPMIGHRISTEHIRTDNEGWYNYIPKKGLRRYHPLILVHYRRFILMIIPTYDWQELCNDSISVAEYVTHSQWNYGYYWGGGSILYGVFWQPFEEMGIHDTEYIARYLEILKCRTFRHFNDTMPDDEQCKDCWVERCPFSKTPEKKNGSSWHNEVQEKDNRKEFFYLVKNRIERQFGFEAIDCQLHSNKNGIWLFPGYGKDTVLVYLPKRIMLDLLYSPGKYNLPRIVDSWTVHIGIPCHMEGDNLIGASRQPIPKGQESKMVAYDIWKIKCPGQITKWGLADPLFVPITKEKPKKRKFMKKLFRQK